MSRRGAWKTRGKGWIGDIYMNEVLVEAKQTNVTLYLILPNSGCDSGIQQCTRIYINACAYT